MAGLPVTMGLNNVSQTHYWVREGNRLVQTGYVPYIKVNDCPVREALKALLIPLNLYYKLGPGFIFISTP